MIECLIVGQLSAGPQEEKDEQDKGSDPEALKSSQGRRMAPHLNHLSPQDGHAQGMTESHL